LTDEELAIGNGHPAEDVGTGRPGFDVPASRRVEPVMNEIREVIERKAALLETGDVKAVLAH
jgi:hypothetical protein